LQGARDEFAAKLAANMVLGVGKVISPRPSDATFDT
jgi:hypothetical protein